MKYVMPSPKYIAAPESFVPVKPVTFDARTEVAIVIVSVPPGVPPCEIDPPSNCAASLLYAIKSSPAG